MEECPDGSSFFRDEGEFYFDKRFKILMTVVDWRMLCRELGIFSTARRKKSKFSGGQLGLCFEVIGPDKASTEFDI